MSNALSYMGQITRRQDRDRFLCTLFAPADMREGHYVLLAFNAELAKIREMVSEPLLGEIRLQWWRDIIKKIYSNPAVEVDDHAVVIELAKVIRKYNLSRGLFDKLINARSRDMIDEPPNDEAELRNYAAATASTLNALLMEISSPFEKTSAGLELAAAEHIGVAWSLAGILRASSLFAKYKRVYVPQSLMQEGGFDAYVFMEQKPTAPIKMVVKKIIEFADAEIMQARALTQNKADKPIRAIFFQASLAEMYLNRIKRLDYNPFDPRIEGGRPWRQLRLSLMAVRGSF